MGDELPTGHELFMAGLVFLDDLVFRRDYGPPLTEKELTNLSGVVEGINATLDALRSETAAEGASASGH